MSIFIFIIGIIVLIVVHEFGHFVAAKLAKMRVDEFGFGFPPKLFGFKKGPVTLSPIIAYRLIRSVPLIN